MSDRAKQLAVGGKFKSRLPQKGYSVQNSGINTIYGTKYIINGNLKTPSGKELNVKTIWIIDTGQEIPRFVTAYPT